MIETLERMTMTVREVQAALGVGSNTAYRIVQMEGFPRIQTGRRILIPREEFFRWLKKQSYKTDEKEA